MAVGDVNGDGKPDLIVANTGSNTVSVLLNTHDAGRRVHCPAFAAQPTFATGSIRISVAAADVNGDGKPDLVVANARLQHGVGAAEHDGAGRHHPSFAAQQTFATGSIPASVAAADLNGDGKPDLVVANYGSNTVSVLLNTTAPGATTPSFAAQQTFATGSQPRLGGGGGRERRRQARPDRRQLPRLATRVSVLLNTTAPAPPRLSFAAQQTFATGSNPCSVAVADVNGDGKPDLIVANHGSQHGVGAAEHDGAGRHHPRFAAQQTFATGSHPFSVAVADVNGDGKPDLIVANYGSNTVSVLLNTTAPGATTPASPPSRPSPPAAPRSPWRRRT